MADQPSGPAPTLGSIMYGDSAATGLDQARSIMERGKARDAPVPEAPPVTTERDPFTAALYGPAPQPPKSATATPKTAAAPPPSPQSAKPEAKPAEAKTEAKPGTPGARGAAFDPASSPIPEGADPSLWGEFGEAAKALNLDKPSADRLVGLHQKAMQGLLDQHDRTAAEWAAETRAAYTPAELRDITTAFNARIGNDADAQAFKAHLNWTGLGNNLSFIRTVERLLRSR